MISFLIKMNKWKSGCQVNRLCQNPVFAVAVMKNKEKSIQVTIVLNESSVSASVLPLH